MWTEGFCCMNVVDKYFRNWVSSVIEIGIACTTELPRNRVNISTVRWIASNKRSISKLRGMAWSLGQIDQEMKKSRMELIEEIS